MDGTEKEELRRTIREKDCRIEALVRQLEARTNLMRMVIHDLKGPLGSVIANLDLLQSRDISGAEKRELLDTAALACNDLLTIINTLLEIGKMEREKLDLNLSIIDLAEMFKTVAAKLKALCAEKNITVETACRGTISSLAADAGLLERILFNLIMNALKHSREGGTITLSTADDGAENRVLIGVSDTGVGIPREFQETIFDLYAQAPSDGRPRDGRSRDAGENGKAGRGRPRMVNAGIGLAFCRLAVEQHGGRIWVESEEGKGSRFYVSLPTDLTPSGSGLV